MIKITSLPYCGTLKANGEINSKYTGDYETHNNNTTIDSIGYKVIYLKEENKYMTWFNIYGLVFVTVILIPNIVFAATHKDGFENKYQNKTVEFFEQIGRFSCFGFMFLSPPVICQGFWFDGAKMAYIIVGMVLVMLYCLGWVVFWRENSVRKALALSILPSVLFFESGVLILHIPLIILSVIFAFCHITISYKNVVQS